VFTFDPSHYGIAFGALLDPRRPDDLGPGRPNTQARPALDALSLETVFESHELADVDAARCCLSGIWLLHNYLDESHSISQDIASAEGSYWHAIMHRREPDYGNAKYWFRRVGTHPIDVDLAAEARRLAAVEQSLDPQAQFLAEETPWDAFRFVDLCESVARGKSSARDLCLAVARIEWQLLFDYCYRQALGDPHPGA
jgi:hypothetical protein